MMVYLIYELISVAYSVLAIYTLCLRKKRHPFYFFLIFLSDIIWFCQFLAETYRREFETNMLHRPPHVGTVPCKNLTRHGVVLAADSRAS